MCLGLWRPLLLTGELWSFVAHMQPDISSGHLNCSEGDVLHVFVGTRGSPTIQSAMGSWVMSGLYRHNFGFTFIGNRLLSSRFSTLWRTVAIWSKWLCRTCLCRTCKVDMLDWWCGRIFGLVYLTMHDFFLHINIWYARVLWPQPISVPLWL